MRVGIDIGGTKTDAVAIDETDRVVGQVKVPTGFGEQAVVDVTADAVIRLAESLGVAVADFESVGVGIPGAIDSEAGRVSHAVNLGVEDLALGPELSARLGLHVRVENDVNAAANDTTKEETR